MNIPREKLEREAFEKWASEEWEGRSIPDNAWLGWKARAALSSIEAELEQPQQPVHLVSPVPTGPSTTQAAFETWAQREGFNIHRDDSEKYREYHRTSTRWAWLGWLAATQRAADCLRAKADEQAKTNAAYPEHAKAYPSWIQHEIWLRWLADDLSAVEAESERHGDNKTEPASASASSQPQGEQSTAPESPQAAAQSTSEWVDANVSGNPALVQAMKNHAEAAQSTAQWVMVPREPDDDMVDAACEAGNLFRVDFTRAWEASIAAAPSAQSTALEPVACKRCNGTGVVDDGESDCSDGGIPYENGPIKCVKDCPVCRGASALATPSAAMALLGEARAELADLMEVAERCDSWQSFPNAPLEKARAFIARIDALTGTGRKEQSNG